MNGNWIPIEIPNESGFVDDHLLTFFSSLCPKYLSIILAFQFYNYFKYGLAFNFSILIATLWGMIIVFVLLTALFGFYASAQKEPNFLRCVSLISVSLTLSI